jgi:hypothetical protein
MRGFHSIPYIPRGCMVVAEFCWRSCNGGSAPCGGASVHGSGARQGRRRRRRLGGRALRWGTAGPRRAGARACTPRTAAACWRRTGIGATRQQEAQADGRRRRWRGCSSSRGQGAHRGWAGEDAGGTGQGAGCAGARGKGTTALGLA